MATIEVNLKEAKSVLQAALRAKTSVFLSGPPGVGKSAIVQEVAEENGVQYTDLRLLLLDPTDLKGLPSITDGKTTWNRPYWLPEGDDDAPRLVFLDEINAAPQTVQAAAYQIVQEHRIGEHILPPNTVVWAAGNRVEDRAVVHSMPSPLKSRFLTLHVRIDVECWLEWAWKQSLDERVLGFISFKGNCLADYERVQEDSFATPRGWEILSNLMQSSPDMDKNSLNIAAAGTIGEGTAAEFMSFMNYYSKLPPMEDILEGRVEYIPEEEPALMYALCTAMALKAHGDVKKGRYLKPAFKYAMSLPAGLTEFATLLGINIYRQYPAVSRLITEPGDNSFKQWVKKYGAYITDEVALS